MKILSDDTKKYRQSTVLCRIEVRTKLSECRAIGRIRALRGSSRAA